MIDYQMTIILNAALDLRNITPESIEKFKKVVCSALQREENLCLCPKYFGDCEFFKDGKCLSSEI